MKNVIIVMTALMVVSCAPKDKGLNISDTTLKKRSLDVVVGKTPSFSLMTGGTAGSWGALLGPVGLIAAQASANSNGDELVRQNNIEDPAIEIADKLSKGLRDKKGLILTSSEPKRLETDNDKLISEMYKDSDYMLKVNTYWGTVHNLAGSLRVMYSANMTLKDEKNGEVKSSSYCLFQTDADYGLDELRDNGASKLKEALNKGRDECITKLSKVLGI